MKSSFILHYGFTIDDEENRYVIGECHNIFNPHGLVFPESICVKKKLEGFLYASVISTLELNLRYKGSRAFR